MIITSCLKPPSIKLPRCCQMSVGNRGRRPSSVNFSLPMKSSKIHAKVISRFQFTQLHFGAQSTLAILTHRGCPSGHRNGPGCPQQRSVSQDHRMPRLEEQERTETRSATFGQRQSDLCYQNPPLQHTCLSLSHEDFFQRVIS